VAESNLAIQPLELRNCPTYRRYFFGYDGTLVCTTSDHKEEEAELLQVPWNRYKLLQPMPRRLRVFDGGNKIVMLQRAVNLWNLVAVRPFILGVIFTQ